MKNPNYDTTEALIYLAGFPTEYAKLSEQDQEAVSRLLQDLWEPTIGQKRVTTYVELAALYSTDEEGVETADVPEYVEKLGHILTCRYAPLPDDALLRADRNVRQLTQSLTALVLRSKGQTATLSKEELEAVPESYEMSETRNEDGSYVYAVEGL